MAYLNIVAMLEASSSKTKQKSMQTATFKISINLAVFFITSVL